MSLFGFISIFAIGILIRRSRKTADQPPGPIRMEQVLAAAVAYATYVSAAMIAGAKFPQFLRDHLFDGLAPAALVGALIYVLTTKDMEKAFDRVTRPYIVPLRFCLVGSTVFGFIAGAAVFSSGASDYAKPVLWAIGIGALPFSSIYIGAGIASRQDFDGHSRAKRFLSAVRWWFKPRARPLQARNKGGNRMAKSSKFRERLKKFDELEQIKDLDGTGRAFWDDVWVNRLRGIHSRSKEWKSWGEGLRLPALAAGAAVPALAPFSGLYVRIATASLAALAVTLNGAATLFHIDQRTIVNRRYEGMLLEAGWNFALGLNPYTGNDAFSKFEQHVLSILRAYDTAYETSIYVPPAGP